MRRRRVLDVLCLGILIGAAQISWGATVAVIEIRDEISKGLARALDRSITEAESFADAIVFDIHTPGGRVDAMGEIVNRIFESRIPTVAYVRTEAISAGAVIALSCDRLVMAPGGAIGDAAPVTAGGQELGEKAISYIRGKIRAVAERNGRNPDVVEAMVDKSTVLVRLNGEVKALTPGEFQELKEKGTEMEIISPEGRLLTLTADEALELGLADLKAESLDRLLSELVLVEQEGERRLLTRTQLETQRSADDSSRVLEYLEGAEVRRVQRTLLEKFAIAVTGSLLGSLLLTLGMLGLIVEMRTPGFGLPGLLGLLCVGLFFGGHMLVEVQATWGLIAFLAGLGLLALEVFVIPGFGVAGISGIVLSLGGLFFVFGRSAPDLTSALTSFLATLVATAVLAGLALAYLPRTRAWDRLVLHTAETAAAGYQAPRTEMRELVGRVGVALTPLRPVGTAEFDGQRVDVVAEGEFIPKGTPVRVVQVEGPSVVVRAEKATSQTPS
ncbi:MAG: serine protease [Candidatus Poribacteria bacterium]|nr:MAG: serine protease [Candidatus Poribacteria bacterium]